MATMINQKTSVLGPLIAQNKDQILREWIVEMNDSARRGDLMKEGELRSQCTRFLDLLAQGTAGGGTNLQSGAYDPMREMLAEISTSRAQQGFSAKETATFVFSKISRHRFHTRSRAFFRPERPPAHKSRPGTSWAR